ncbi:hypothetical protein [Pseudomonas sp.]|uniref:hypothetical protein n=1 Tax=Pseudomonas sp. TaxID=306 RepID=UPI001A012FAB|nr:hypothetical protein [Pseudomonas sp.]MBF0675594.1 hypothetical protein [Pseudomonas sp.]
MKPEDFYVRTRASQGVRVDLADPAGNREWVRVRSVAADEFMAARNAALLLAVSDGMALGGDAEQRKRILRMRRAELAASLVADWSLPMKTGPEKVELLLRNPRLRRQIERIAEDHSLHFGASA